MFTSTLELDPEGMNIRNRIAAGCRMQGEMLYAQGLLLEGSVYGEPLHVDGHLVVLQGGQLMGKIVVKGNLYLLGSAGEEQNPVSIDVHGLAVFGETSRVYGRIAAQTTKMYQGARISSSLESL